MAKYIDPNITGLLDNTVKVADQELSKTVSGTKNAFESYVKDQDRKHKDQERAQLERDRAQTKFQENFNQMLGGMHAAFTNINSAVQSLNARLRFVEESQAQHENFLSKTAESLKESKDTIGAFPKEHYSTPTKDSHAVNTQTQAPAYPTEPSHTARTVPTTETVEQSFPTKVTRARQAQQTKTDASRTPEDVGATKQGRVAAAAQGSTTTDRGTDVHAGSGEQATEAARLQDLKDSTRNVVVVKVLEQIRDFLVGSLSQFEKFNDELRRSFHVNGETSAKIMEATLGARKAVKDVLDVHVSVSESVNAIKNQVLKNDVNAAKLNDSTLSLITGLDKFGVNVQRDTLLALDYMRMNEDAQRLIHESLMAASSGENSIRTDTAKLSQDLEKVIGLAQGAMKSGDETAKLMSQYTKDVQRMVNSGVEQSKAQQLALADLKSSVGLYGEQGQLQLWREMAGFLSSEGIKVNGMSSADMQDAFRELLTSNKEASERLTLYTRQLQQRGSEDDYRNAMNLLNMANTRKVHIATVDEAREGEKVPFLESLKDDISASVQGALSGVTSVLWGAAGQGTLLDTVKRGFNLVIAAISAQSILKAFPQAKDFLETTAKGTGAMSKMAKGILSITGGGLKSVVGKLGLIAAPLAGILAAIGGIYTVVQKIGAWRLASKDKDEAEARAKEKADELSRFRSEMARAYREQGESREYRALKSRVSLLESEYDESLGNVIKAERDQNKSAGGMIGAGAGFLTGGAAGLKLGTRFGNSLGAKGKLIGAGLGALAGATLVGLAGEGLGASFSSEDTAESRNALRARYASAEGNIFSQESLTYVAENNAPEAVLPATKPERMKVLAEEMSRRTDIPDASKEAFKAMLSALNKSLGQGTVHPTNMDYKQEVENSYTNKISSKDRKVDLRKTEKPKLFLSEKLLKLTKNISESSKGYASDGLIELLEAARQKDMTRPETEYSPKSGKVNKTKGLLNSVLSKIHLVKDLSPAVGFKATASLSFLNKALNAFTSDATSQSFVGFTSEDLITPTLKQLKEKEREAGINKHKHSSRDLGEATNPFAFTKLRDRYSLYIDQLKESYDGLKGLGNTSIIKESTDENRNENRTRELETLNAVEASMLSLTKHLEDLTEEIKKQNRERDIDRLHMSSFPMQSRISAR